MAAMHFWGVEVKGKEPKSVTLEEGQIIHISQVTLGELKKDKEPVIIHLKVGDKKLVMGILNQNAPQLAFDLVLDQDFEISHNWKSGSVHFLGYDSDMPEEENFDFSEDEDVPAAVSLRENGKPGASAPVKAPAQKDNKVKLESKAEDDDEDDSEDDDDEDDSEDDDESDEELDAMGDDDDDDDTSGSDSSDKEETPKPDPSKKRKSVVVKTPESKKAKLATPQKTDGKKGGAHTATPHPSKKAGKSGDKPTPKSKSGGQLSCGPCNKTFSNEIGLQSHNKAKHAK